MATSLDDLIGKIPGVDGVYYEGVGRLNFATSSGLTIVPTLSPGSAGTPTTLTLAFSAIALADDPVEDAIPAWDADGALKSSGVFVDPAFDEEDPPNFAPGFYGYSFAFGGYNQSYAFSSDWLDARRVEGTNVVNRIVAKARNTLNGDHQGQRAELVGSVEDSAPVVADEIDMELVLLYDSNDVAQIPEINRVYVFEALLDLKVDNSTHAIARVTFACWNNSGGTPTITAPVLTEIAGAGEDYSWSNATITTNIVDSIPRLLVAWTLTGDAAGSHAVRITVKHSHTRRPE